MVDDAFCKATDGSFGRSIVGREDKFMSRASVSSSNNNLPCLPWWKWSNVINLTPGSWLIPSGDGATLGAQCCLFSWQIRHSAVAVATSVSVNASPSCWAYNDLHYCHHGHFVQESTGAAGEGGCVMSIEWGHLIHLIIKTFLYPLVNIHIEYRYLHILPFREVCPHTTFWSLLIFHLCSSPTTQPNHDLVQNHLFPGKMNKLVYCFKFCPLGRHPFTTIFQGRLERGFSAVAVHFQVIHAYQAEPGLFFLGQLNTGNSPWRHGYAERENVM